MKRFNFGKHKKEEEKGISLIPLKRFDIDTLIDDLFTDSFGGLGLFNTAAMPAMDVYEKDNRMIVKADLPGIDKKDIKLHLDRDLLTISAETNREKEMEKKGCYCSERYFGKIQRSVRLPEEAGTKDIKASYKNGVLTIEIPKSEKDKEKGRDIEVE